MLASPGFLNFAVPLLAVFLTIFLKIVSRNDRFQAFKLEDFAIGPDLSVTGLLLFITDSAAKARSILKVPNPEHSENLEQTPWILLFFVILIWGVSTLVRKKGWDANGELVLLWGVVIPGLFGLTSLVFVVLRIG
jgi:hypothetical protein